MTTSTAARFTLSNLVLDFELDDSSPRQWERDLITHQQLTTPVEVDVDGETDTDELTALVADAITDRWGWCVLDLEIDFAHS